MNINKLMTFIFRNMNLNQCKNRSLLEVGRYFNVGVEIYYFCQFTVLISFFSFRYGFFYNKKNKNKKTITNFLICQFTILTPFLSCWLINLGVFLIGKRQ